LARGFRHSPRWRHRICRRGPRRVLRFVARQGHRLGRQSHGGLPAHGSRAARVPHPRRQDQHPVPGERRQSSAFPRRRGHHYLPRRFAGTLPLHGPCRPRHQAALLHRRCHSQRQSEVKGKKVPEFIEKAPVPAAPGITPPPGTRQLLQKLGPEKFAAWARKEKRLLLTDTTFRDAHQSLMATRVRGYDMLATAHAVAQRLPNLFSLEMWGGATFDTSLRFLHEDPWQRLRALRAHIPNICFQMLLRGANAVGYTSYPDNVIVEFVREAHRQGIDIFRIFDSLNSIDNMRVSIDAVLETGAVCEPAICYTGDILDDRRPKYSLKYYLTMAKQLEKLGAHFLAIKDMAGLCKPYAAFVLVK